MSTEAQIRNLVEHSKIGKSLKEKLISFGKAKDEELKPHKAEMFILKDDHEEKVKISMSTTQRWSFFFTIESLLIICGLHSLA